MATATRQIGPADHGRRLTLDEFAVADFAEGWLYELARGIVVATEVPEIQHGRIVNRLARLFILYDIAHPGIINYRAGGGECRLRFPEMQSDRHPDQAIYLTPPPAGPHPWARWIPALVVEIVSAGGEGRDYVEKHEEYLRAGVQEYSILDPAMRRLLVLLRDGDAWREVVVGPDEIHRSPVLPGLEARPSELLGPAEEE